MDERMTEVRCQERGFGDVDLGEPEDSRVLERGREAARRAGETRRAVASLLGSLSLQDTQTTGGQ